MEEPISRKRQLSPSSSIIPSELFLSDDEDRSDQDPTVNFNCNDFAGFMLNKIRKIADNKNDTENINSLMSANTNSEDIQKTIYAHWHYTDYADEILNVLREREQRRQQYLDQSPEIRYRNDLVDFVRSIGATMHLSKTTVHLGIYLLDIFMDNHRIIYELLFMVALCTLLIATKLENRDVKFSDMNMYLENQYSLKNYIPLERLILNFFNFDLLIPTAATFIEYYIEGIITQSDFENPLNKNIFVSCKSMKEAVTGSAYEFLDLSLFSNKLLQEVPSKLAAACLAAARYIFKVEPIWNEYLYSLTKYAYSDLANLVDFMLSCRYRLSADTAVFVERDFYKAYFIESEFMLADEDGDSDTTITSMDQESMDEGFVDQTFNTIPNL